jgi:hypothetical protein
MKNEDTWPKRLEALLTSPERPVAVMNTGVSGYETFHEAFYYNELAPEFQHDLVLVGIYPGERRAREGQEVRALSPALQHLAAIARSVQGPEAALCLPALQ